MSTNTQRVTNNYNAGTLMLKAKDVYGNRTYYPDCTQSKLIADMLQAKTITARNVQYLQRIGFEVLID